MKKKVVFSLLTSAVLISALAGCGGNEQDNSNDNTSVAETEQTPSTQMETEATTETEETTSQLQLGSAVEIPEGWDGQLAEADANEQLERVIAEYCEVSEEDYEKVRYYYNYIDLDGDSKNEMLALVLGQEVSGIDGSTLLLIDNPDEGNLSKDSVKQSFKNVGAPVYISNHMSEGYRDLIVVDNTSMSGGNSTGGNSGSQGSGSQGNNGQENGGQENGGQENGGQENGGQGTGGQSASSGGASGGSNAGDNVSGGSGAENGASGGSGSESGTTGGSSSGSNADSIGAQPKYTLLTWTGEKYQELEEGTVLNNLEGQEGTAIITNNMESDSQNDKHHFLGEALK